MVDVTVFGFQGLQACGCRIVGLADAEAKGGHRMTCQRCGELIGRKRRKDRHTRAEVNCGQERGVYQHIWWGW